MAFSPRTTADEAWRKQLHAVHIQAKASQEPMRVLYLDGRTQNEVPATVLAAHAVYDDFVVRLEDGVSLPDACLLAISDLPDMVSSPSAN